ncbi:hypothetical protein ACSCBZ_42055 [Streptomyces niveiscabiei]|uniref:hypothetical protein n=1 Tax=Streptomyces niveiscabiei TaxID=164115 RepID=UPI00131DBBED|nr:hypothetical protein [Streptomyces niveiscabiei]
MPGLSGRVPERGCEADKSWSTTTHRCTACSFTVRLTRATPGESRRWQEIAAAHPDHTA